MSKETLKNPTQSILFCVETLKYIENDVFFQETATTVLENVSKAFIELLRSDVCEDNAVRNEVLSSWFATLKLVSIIETKELPDNVTSAMVTFEY